MTTKEDSVTHNDPLETGEEGQGQRDHNTLVTTKPHLHFVHEVCRPD